MKARQPLLSRNSGRNYALRDDEGKYEKILALFNNGKLVKGLNLQCQDNKGAGANIGV